MSKPIYSAWFGNPRQCLGYFATAEDAYSALGCVCIDGAIAAAEGHITEEKNVAKDNTPIVSLTAHRKAQEALVAIVSEGEVLTDGKP